MVCNFSYLENECGCLIGYQLPMKTAEDGDVTAYPVNVLNVDGVDLGEAASPSAVVALWNSDPSNQAKGVLSLGNGAFCFTLSYVKGSVPPSKVSAAFEAPEPPQELMFGYLALDIDTTGERPTEQEYMAPAEAGSGITYETFTDGASIIQVDDFGNVEDKVLNIRVPDSQQPFTKWSVVGDPVQQNLPIDNGYGVFVNVVFRVQSSTGFWMYFTTNQTSFSGPLRLSR